MNQAGQVCPRSRSYGNCQSRGWRIGTPSGEVHASSAQAARVRAVSESSTRIAIASTIAHGGSRYQCPYRRLIPITDNFPNVAHTGTTERLRLTSRTKDLLEEIEVRPLDHIVVSRTGTASMAARGLI